MQTASPRSPTTRPRRAFTLVEAVVAIALTAIAGSVLLLGVTSSFQATDESLKRTIAAGIAEQLIDEVLGQRYSAVGTDGYQTALGPSTTESQGKARERYDDIDDYCSVRAQPPVDLWGIELGKDDGQGGTRNAAFQASNNITAAWREEIDVYYVSETDLTTRLPSGRTSDYRAVEVRIVENVPNVGTREWAKVRRIVAYEPLLP